MRPDFFDHGNVNIERIPRLLVTLSAFWGIPLSETKTISLPRPSQWRTLPYSLSYAFSPNPYHENR